MLYQSEVAYIPEQQIQLKTKNNQQINAQEDYTGKNNNWLRKFDDSPVNKVLVPTIIVF